jgi:hypothetical protein
MGKSLVTLVVASVLAALVSTSGEAKPQKQRRAKAQPPTQIACTELGCRPVPPGCTPRPGRTWSGMPSGFDVVVCPGGRTYGRWY